MKLLNTQRTLLKLSRKLPRRSTLACLVLSSALVAGCANEGSFTRGQKGAAIGAVAGAVLGHQVDGDKGRFLGAAVGAIAGNAVGRYMDDQQRELERELSEERASNEISIARLSEDTLKLDLDSEVSFAFNSSALNPAFHSSLNKLAGVLSDYPNTAVHIIGHTDSVGSEEYNYNLSLRRASSVRTFLTRQGVVEPRTRTEGRGENMPVSDNSTEFGRQRNRRVEIYLKTIVEGQEANAFRSPV